MSSKPLISFGLLTDIQYADCDESLNFRKDKPRFYRNSINLVKQAAQYWHANIKQDNLKFIIQLGDIIDCKAELTRDESLNLVLTELKSDFKTLIPDFGFYHIWGNHEFYNYTRQELLNTELNTAALLNQQVSKTANYYIIDVTNELKIICLDIYEFSALGFHHEGDIYKQSVDMLQGINKNENLDSAENLFGLNKRFTKINGAPSKEQMIWLESNLEKLSKENKKVIVCGHTPIHPKSTVTTACLAWNFDEILDLFYKYKNTILAYFCGHDHDGGYHLAKKSKIHYITFPAIVEAPHDVNSFATIKVFHDRVSIEGFGLVKNYEILFLKSFN